MPRALPALTIIAAAFLLSAGAAAQTRPAAPAAPALSQQAHAAPLSGGDRVGIGLADGGEALGRMRSAAPSGRRSGELYDQVARVDSLLFDALFVECDADRAIALLTEDIEFYDDRTGLSVGDDLRGDFRRLTESCPGRGGVRRVLLPKTVEVFTIEGWGALQTGVHHFVEDGASTRTIARFHHLWRRMDGAWKLARVVSLHEVVEEESGAPE